MVTLPQLIDPTLEAADRALEERALLREPRAYLGASIIGHECQRRLWYDFRWAKQEKLTAVALRRIEDGYRGEDLQAERLRMVPGLTLLTTDPETGRQWKIEDHGGHFRGHLDGALVGLIQAPKTWHVWEHKQVAEDKLAKLEKLKTQMGEKAALLAWNVIYWAQAQVYMHYTGMERHYLTVASPGGRRTVSVRTKRDPEQGSRLADKAQRIIYADRPPTKVSEDPAYHLCRMCPHASHCHGGELPLRSCRTCIFASPHPKGGWECLKHNCRLEKTEQQRGCPDQRLIPDIVPGVQFDAASDGSWVSYRMKSGDEWIDRGANHD